MTPSRIPVTSFALLEIGLDINLSHPVRQELVKEIVKRTRSSKHMHMLLQRF